MDLFVNFLQDEKVYEQARIYWENMFIGILRKYKKENEWSQWFSGTFVNGAPMRTGNPISSWLCKEKGRGVKIIQESSSYLPIIAYTDIFDKEHSDIETLTIDCYLTEETSRTAVALIDAWIGEELTIDCMQRKIEELIP